MDKKDLPHCLRKYADRIASISDERGYGEGCWVYLKDTFWSDVMGCRTIHEDSWKACVELVEDAVPNEQTDCTGAKA
jgi:hypothetical protein